MGFRSKFNSLDFLAADNGTNVRLVKTDYTILYQFSRMPWMIQLLAIKCTYVFDPGEFFEIVKPNQSALFKVLITVQ
jgi:hypothetical protein